MIHLLFKQPPRVPSFGVRSLGNRVPRRPHHVPGPQRGLVTGAALRRDARMTEPRCGSCSGGVREWRGSQESARQRSALLGCMTKARWAVA